MAAGAYMTYLYLAAAILAEVGATAALPHVQTTRLAPLVIVVCGYIIAFLLLRLALQGMPLASAYAIWSGAGIVLVAVAGWVFQRQPVDGRSLAGIALIVAGIFLVKSMDTGAPG